LLCGRRQRRHAPGRRCSRITVPQRDERGRSMAGPAVLIRIRSRWVTCSVLPHIWHRLPRNSSGEPLGQTDNRLAVGESQIFACGLC
jgi:hypothetical protein